MLSSTGAFNSNSELAAVSVSSDKSQKWSSPSPPASMNTWRVLKSFYFTLLTLTVNISSYCNSLESAALLLCLIVSASWHIKRRTNVMLLCSVFLYFPGRAIPIRMDAEALQVPQQRPVQPCSRHTFISAAKSIRCHFVWHLCAAPPKRRGTWASLSPSAIL